MEFHFHKITERCISNDKPDGLCFSDCTDSLLRCSQWLCFLNGKNFTAPTMNCHCLPLYMQNHFDYSYFCCNIYIVFTSANYYHKKVSRQPYFSRHFLLQEALYKSKEIFLQNKVPPSVVTASESCSAPDLNTPGWGRLLVAFSNYPRSPWFKSEDNPTFGAQMKDFCSLCKLYIYWTYRIYFKILQEEASPSSELSSVLTGKVSQKMKGNIPFAAEHFTENKIENASHSDVLMALGVWY